MSLTRLDQVIKYGYIVIGAFGAYSLGANNAANVIGIYLHIGGVAGSPLITALIGGVAISIGVLAFSKPLMTLIGEGLAPLTHMTGLIVVLSATIVVYLYALIGIPVSTSQAVIGSVFGAGLVKGVKTVKYSIFGRILIAWFVTPIAPGLLSYLSGVLLHR